MRQRIIAYLATALVLLSMDATWLTHSIGFYRAHIGFLLRETPNLPVAALFYGLYILGVVVFAVMPGLRLRSWRAAAWRAALLGLVAYATYDLTNLATVKGFPASVAWVDMAWGVILSTVSASLGYAVAARFGEPTRRFK